MNSVRWKRTLLGIGMILVGVALGFWPTDGFVLPLTAGLILGAAGITTILTAWSGRYRTEALFRVDHFLPSLKRSKKVGPLAPPTPLGRLMERLLPASWFVDRSALKPGKLRRWLQKIGPTALSSPVRRIVQTVCLLVFLVLFFHVCWPYTARPKAPAEISEGWQFTGIDESSGYLRFSHEAINPLSSKPGDVLYLTDSMGEGTKSGVSRCKKRSSSS
jgi:hypothetical protein